MFFQKEKSKINPIIKDTSIDVIIGYLLANELVSFWPFTFPSVEIY